MVPLSPLIVNVFQVPTATILVDIHHFHRRSNLRPEHHWKDLQHPLLWFQHLFLPRIHQPIHSLRPAVSSLFLIPGGDSDPVGRSTRLALRASFWQPRSYDTKDPYYDSFSFVPLLLPGYPTSPFYPLHGIPFSTVSGFLGSSFALQETVSVATDKVVFSRLLFDGTVGVEINSAIAANGLTSLSSFASIYSTLGPDQPAASRYSSSLIFWKNIPLIIITIMVGLVIATLLLQQEG